jgi:hypothetical protein
MDSIQRCALQGQKNKINAMKRDFRHESRMMGKDGTESQLRTTAGAMNLYRPQITQMGTNLF